MMYYYEWTPESEEESIAVYQLLRFLLRLEVGYTYVSLTKSYDTNMTLSVTYKKK